MFKHAQGAESGPAHAPEHDRGRAGVDRVGVITVDPSGRSVEAVVAALAALPVELGRLIEGKSRDHLMKPAQDGGWGLVEILPHLRDWEEIVSERVTAILEQDEPTLEEYDDSLWAIEHGYRDQDPHASFEAFVALRTALVERLRGLDPAAWNRVGILPKRGRVTLHWLLDSLCNHDTKHLVQARDVLA